MRKKKRSLRPAGSTRIALMLAAAALTAIITTTAARARPAAARAPADAGDDQKEQALFTRTCVKCHTPDRIVSQRRTRDQWNEVLDTMASKGAQATDDEFDAILDYLLRHYGRVNVNRAPAADLVLVLQLKKDDASAIVAYRTAHGPFEDFDALARVPNVDVARLTAMRDAISF